MSGTNAKLAKAVDIYFADLTRFRASGGGTGERAFSDAERAAMGEMTFDIHLNNEAFWRNVPAAVWTYSLGGYQALKKWLSYRERDILGRPLHPEEVQHFTDTARRIVAIIEMNFTDPA